VTRHRNDGDLAGAGVERRRTVVTNPAFDERRPRDEQHLEQHQDRGDDAERPPGRVHIVDRGERLEAAVGKEEGHADRGHHVDRAMSHVGPPGARR